MISVCGSIYRNPEFLTFVRSVIDNAAFPENIEFVCVEDEAGDEDMLRSFEASRKHTPNITIIQISKSERISYIRRCLCFYEKMSIFSKADCAEMTSCLDNYERRDRDILWFPTGRNHNIAVKKASGDVIFNTPMDVEARFDLSIAYDQFKNELKNKANLCTFFGLAGHNEELHHGFRIFNKPLFDTLRETDLNFSEQSFSFEERWPTRALHDDLWNYKAGQALGQLHGWSKIFGDKKLLAMNDTPYIPKYLSAKIPLENARFVKEICKYLGYTPT